MIRARAPARVPEAPAPWGPLGPPGALGMRGSSRASEARSGPLQAAAAGACTPTSPPGQAAPGSLHPTPRQAAQLHKLAIAGRLPRPTTLPHNTHNTRTHHAPAKNDLQVLLARDRVELAHEQHVAGRLDVRVGQVAHHLQHHRPCRQTRDREQLEPSAAHAFGGQQRLEPFPPYHKAQAALPSQPAGACRCVAPRPPSIPSRQCLPGRPLNADPRGVHPRPPPPPCATHLVWASCRRVSSSISSSGRSSWAGTCDAT
jgi:hypothetical protein